MCARFLWSLPLTAAMALVTSALPVTAGARSATVSVNDRPVDVAAIIERGRVMLPMRATFEILGASVVYRGAQRMVEAHDSLHHLQLLIGSKTARVDGKYVRLDVPARIIANRTYVPLRFAAQAFGATVGYDARTSLVTVNDAANAPRAKLGTPGAAFLDPPPNQTVSSSYPTISASLQHATAARGDVHLLLDGADVTDAASFDGATITYVPRVGLPRGAHSVIFSGRTLAGDPFQTQWSFETALSAPPESDGPAFDGYQFYTNGPSWFYSGDWMHFVLVAPPGGSAVLRLCDLGYDYPFWNGGSGSTYQASMPVPYGYWIPSCPVTAVYTAWNGARTYVPIPVFIGIYTLPHNGAFPAPAATAMPVQVRRGGPVYRRPPVFFPPPTPAPAAHAAPVPLPVPIRVAPAPPHSRPEPAPHPLPSQRHDPESRIPHPKPTPPQD